MDIYRERGEIGIDRGESERGIEIEIMKARITFDIFGGYKKTLSRVLGMEGGR